MKLINKNYSSGLLINHKIYLSFTNWVTISKKIEKVDVLIHPISLDEYIQHLDGIFPPIARLIRFDYESNTSKILVIMFHSSLVRTIKRTLGHLQAHAFCEGAQQAHCSAMSHWLGCRGGPRRRYAWQSGGESFEIIIFIREEENKQTFQPSITFQKLLRSVDCHWVLIITHGGCRENCHWLAKLKAST
jgi:hypothetical protein